MDDVSRGAIDAETPVNPYSLLEAVNRAGNSASTAWLIFLALIAYLFVTVAGVSHKDLLLGTDITLPILQVKIELTRFFLVAPVMIVLLHAGLIGKLVLLARKTLEFATSIRMLETTDRRTHPLRLELDSFFFVQALAGPERSRLVGLLLHAISWLSVVVLPVGLLLYVQLAFLPYHDASITWVHRAALLADIALLAFVGVFLWRPEPSYPRAFLRTAVHHPFSLALTVAFLAAAASFSLFVATIPRDSQATSARAQAGNRSSALSAFGLSSHGPILGLFHRNLSVTDTELVADRSAAPGTASLNLRGRDLRFARLDRTDLRRADMTGADLEGASLAGADLRDAAMGCADHNQQTDGRRAAGCVHARNANFSKATLTGARLTGIDLRDGRLEEAQLTGALLSHAIMSGASFAGANLDRADLAGASLQGADFKGASLQGAELAGAKLQVTSFAGALMQGANVSRANLQAGSLREADLEGANLQMARLQGADLSGARLQATDMKGAVVWRTKPPGELPALADLSQLALQPPTEDDLTAFGAALGKVEDASLKTRLADGLAMLSNAGKSNAWGNSPEQQLWLGFTKAEATAADTYKARLTEHLVRTMCRPHFASGSVASGLARRASAPGFRGDVLVLHDKLRAGDCLAGGAISPSVMRELATAAEAARESIPPPSLTQARSP